MNESTKGNTHETLPIYTDSLTDCQDKFAECLADILVAVLASNSVDMYGILVRNLSGHKSAGPADKSAGLAGKSAGLAGKSVGFADKFEDMLE